VLGSDRVPVGDRERLWQTRSGCIPNPDPADHTFACRVYRGGAGESPVGRVVRRGDEIEVGGPPERHGKFDRFEFQGGFVMVPRSRWAWA